MKLLRMSSLSFGGSSGIGGTFVVDACVLWKIKCLDHADETPAALR